MHIAWTYLTYREVMNFTPVHVAQIYAYYLSWNSEHLPNTK